MAELTLHTTLQRPFDEVIDDVRHQLSEVGFGILTEIDLKATLKEKLDKDIAPQTILGACRPQLAYEALQADPSIAALLPCNVVVRALDEESTIVEAFNPSAMMEFGSGGDHDISEVADDAKARLERALTALG